MAPAAGPLNLLNLADDGTFAVSGAFHSSPTDVDALFDHLRTGGAQHLLLYFHGGRVSEQQGRASAEALLPLFQEHMGIHPLFVIWESSEAEIIRRNLTRIQQDPIFGRLLGPLLKFVISKLEDTGEGRGLMLPLVTDETVEERSARELAGETTYSEPQRAGLLPVSDDEAEQLQDYLLHDIAFQKAVQELIGSLSGPNAGRGALGGNGSTLPQDSMLSAEVLAELQREVDAAEAEGRGVITLSALLKPATFIFIRSVTRIRARIDHGIYCTVVEELLRELFLDKVGQWLWSGMKREAHAAFATNAGRSGIQLHGGTYLLDQLRIYLADPSNPPLRVSLVGHSAGTISICALLDAARQILPATFAFDTIVFLAPAVDFELCRRALVDHPERFRRFRMYTMLDSYEVCDGIMPPIYPRSLLYFVSGLLEGAQVTPLVGLERYYSAQPPYDEPAITIVRSFMLADSKQRTVWSVAEDQEGGLNCGAISHGSFIEDRATQESLKHILRGEA